MAIIRTHPQRLLLLIIWALQRYYGNQKTLCSSFSSNTPQSILHHPPRQYQQIYISTIVTYVLLFFCVQMSNMLHHEAEAPYVSSPQHWYYRIPMTYHPKVVSPKRWDGFDLLESPPFLEVPALRQGLDFRVRSWRLAYGLLEFWWRSTIIFLVVV